MKTRRVVMMAFAVSLGTAMSASAQTPGQSPLIGLLLQRIDRNVSVLPIQNSNLVPVGVPTGNSSPTLKVDPLIDTPKAPPAAECGPRPPRPV